MRGGKSTPRRRSGAVPTGLSGIRYEAGLTVKAMAHKIGTDHGFVRRLEKGGTIPKNHPWLPRAAAAYNVPLASLAPQLADKEMSAPVVARLAGQKLTRAKKPGTALVKVPKKPDTAVARGPYNKLKKLSKESRQVVRGIIEVLNLNALKGNKYVELRAVPAGALGSFLDDYLKMKGITGNMILTPDFVDHFDH